ncbi:MAG: septal ring lytic transglycosylase RlpA family protein [Rhodospirillales bacterium]|nr:septal ring lytic transglycosylase RlpA family protein [Rhodospirillales bacterium]
MKKFSAFVVLAVAAILASACTETKVAPEAVKSTGRYKVGKPYKVSGKWYHPEVDEDYDETGVASWYGPGFHGKKTANGEIYDMNDLTAAHPTLPLPSAVKVTNLENGRSIQLRVNDRGPFAYDRIIDVSRRGAQLLGFREQGVTQVRVQILSEESRAMREDLVGYGAPAALPEALEKKQRESEAATRKLNTGQLAGYRASATPPASATAFAAPAPATLAPMAAPTPQVLADEVVESPKHYVQAGAFSHRINAVQVLAQLRYLGPAEIDTVVSEGRELHRVRLGPLANADEADHYLDAAIRSGFPLSRVVYE